MIKINLLESVTEKQGGMAVAVEQRVANPRAQMLLMGLFVFGLLVVGMFYDYMSANAAHAEAQKELDKQQRINQQMLAITKEQAEVEKKTREIQARIDAIQKLRASQQGPGAVLGEIKARFDRVPNLYFKSVEQKDNDLTIKGESPDEASVTRFAQSLEYSDGTFSNLSIETQREAAKVEENSPSAASSSSASSSTVDTEAPKPEVVSFTIKCTYAGTKPTSPAPASSTNQTANQIARK